MTNYPNSQDNSITLPGVSGISDEDIAISALRDATFAIEKELGITPSGVYSDVRARFDILEARINSPISPVQLSDGYANSPFFLVNTPQSVTLSISDGYGVPTENRLNGSIYLRSDGYANNDFYIRRGGVWLPIQSDPWVAAGDLSGTYLNQTVIGLRTKSLNSSLATVGSTQDGYHLTWDNADGYWRAETGFIAGGDLAAISARFGRTSQKVIKIQSSAVSAVAPTDGYGLIWTAADNQWEPRVRPILFGNSTTVNDGYVLRTNITSNKILQSPSASTTGKIGMVNFGSRSVGASTGTTENYAAILSGDRHSVSGNFGVAVGGDGHVVSGQYAAVVDGYNNTASAQYTTILNGTNNLASQIQAFVLDGYSNTASGANSFVLNGGNNIAAASFSGVLGGISNNVQAGATHSGIGWGFNHLITPTSLSSYILGGNNHTTNGLNNLILNGAYNTISSNPAYSFILDGYSQTITGTSSWIGDGYSHSIAGLYSSILNGNTNVINANSSTILNGSNNTIDVTSINSTILNGISNTVTGCARALIQGNSNSISNSTSTFVFGSTNTVTGTRLFINGSSNILSSTDSLISGSSNNVTSSFSTVLGTSNVVAGSLGYNYVFGQSNTTTSASGYNLIAGLSNQVDGYYSLVVGQNNLATSDGYNSLVHGKYAKARINGQYVQAADNFNGNTPGEAQFSRVVLMGSGAAGSAFQALIPGDGYLTFEDGKSYDFNIRVLVVNNQPGSLVDPTKPARFVYDVLASQEAGVLTFHDVNNTLINQNGTGWTVTIASVGNQLRIQVDTATFPQSPVPFNSSNRRVIATVEWRGITRA